MKKALPVIRWVVGLLFIFSGLIKINDPLGLSYKMQEFFEVWHLNGFNDYTLALSMIMNVFEVVAGVAVIIGWQMRVFSWLLLLLILFFTFLTGYALFSGRIKTCGCFGDCLPLTPAQSFGKDIFLLILILILFVYRHQIHSALPARRAVGWLFVITGLMVYAQFYVLKNLPFIDCLPYKPGKNILEQMKMPAGAVADSFAIEFDYEKNGKQLTFDQAHFPADFDSTYKFVNRHDKLIKKGNGLEPKIVDFSLMTLDGLDTTQEILGNPNPYILVMAQSMDKASEWGNGFETILKAATDKKIPVFLVTADAERAAELFHVVTILKCDATVMKTAARAVPTYMLMQQANIIDKFSYTRQHKILNRINTLK
jgi:uncharacterized membrane protein YphA (DoxX/SURF4 family)